MLALFIFILLRSNVVMTAPALCLISAAASSRVDASPGEPPWPPQDRHLATRRWYDIGQTCLVTIIACVWTSAHPNINGPMDGTWSCVKRRVVTMFCAFFAPEVVLYWAVQQRSTARQIASAYNKEFAAQHHRAPEPAWARIKSMFCPVRKEETRRGRGQPWTATHGFFVQMGGFLLYDKEYPTEVLDYGTLAHLLRSHLIEPLTVAEADLEDRSKGNAISKSIVVLQTSWFVLQCCARWNRNLPVSELEAMTLAFAVLNGATYAVWWHKPQGVGVAIGLHLKDRAGRLDRPVSHTASSIKSQTTIVGGTADPTLEHHKPLAGTEQDRDSLQSFTLENDMHENANTVAGLILLPRRLVEFVLRPVFKMLHAGGNQVRDTTLRIPMFYASPTDTRWGALVSVLVGSVYGGLHLLALMTNFTSNAQSVLWLICSTIMTVTPIVVFINVKMGDLFDEAKEQGPTRLSRFCKFILKLEHTLLVLCYIAARFLILSLAFWGIRRPPPGVLLDLSWLSYIPHL